MKTLFTSLSIVTLFLFSAPSKAQLPCGASDDLLTTYLGLNGLSGVMFDIVAQNNIVVECFNINLGAPAGTAVDVFIWTRSGTHVGFETDSTAWTFVGVAPGVISLGSGFQTYVPFDVDQPVLAGADQAFYFGVTTSGPINYSDGFTLGAVFESDANVQLLEGTGSAYPFGFNIEPRIFNGTMFYSLGTASVEDVESVALFSVRPLAGSEGFQVNIPSRLSGTLTISDVTGRILDEQLVNPNTNMLQVDMNGEGVGLYVVTLNTGSTSRSQKVALVK